MARHEQGGWLRAVTLAATLAAAPAAADDTLIFSPAATAACFAEGGGLEACVGASAGACMQDTPGGTSTVGMGGCLDLERAYWDDALNAAYRALMAELAAVDADYQDLPPEFGRAPSLRAMQRAWIEYRDARCGFERSLWGSGTGGSPAQLGCLMYETARQALYLEEQLGAH